MDTTIVLFLLQDGVLNGAIYALVAVALVLVFAVTRVILFPQGEFVAFGALTLAALEEGRAPGTIGLLICLGLATALLELWRNRKDLSVRRLRGIVGLDLLLPCVVGLLVWWLAPRELPVLADVALTIALVAPIGVYIYRMAFQPLAEASILVLLITAVGVHLALLGLGLVFFGPEGYQTRPLSDAVMSTGVLTITGQSIAIVAVAAALMLLLYLFFEKTLAGKALIAVAVNRIGARLVGIPSWLAGNVAFAMAALIGVVSGVLISPVTTIYYDTGFLIGLKGFIAAILGGLASYPVTVAAALGVGLIEAFASFWQSAYKEAIVFTLIIPVLLWRSLRDPGHDEE